MTLMSPLDGVSSAAAAAVDCRGLRLELPECGGNRVAVASKVAGAIGVWGQSQGGAMNWNWLNQGGTCKIIERYFGFELPFESKMSCILEGNMESRKSDFD